MTIHRTLATRTLSAGLLAVSLLALGTPRAEAANFYYSSCAKLTKVYKNGVAASNVAAAKQVKAGFARPATTDAARKVYSTNKSRLDRDSDGTACERKA